MNLPNRLTLSRLALTGGFVVVMSSSLPGRGWWGLGLFGLAALTDWLDGYLARRWGQITSFGKLMDPLADKVLTAAAFVLLVGEGLVPGWVVVIILAREFGVTGMRLVAAGEGRVLAAENLGKWKTVVQMVAILYLLLTFALVESGWEWAKQVGVWVVGQVLMWAAVILTAWSGGSYFLKNREVFRGG